LRRAFLRKTRGIRREEVLETETIETERVPILVWGDVTDEGTLAQARNLANLPFAFHHIALMADAHVGYGMPIGGVLATLGEVIPHAVGLDIGCGMRAWPTGIAAEEVEPVKQTLLHDITRSVPTGFHHHKQSQARRTALFESVPDVTALLAEVEKAEFQVGSLGGGNHFIELQVADGGECDGMVWAMVHSGSRNVGKQMGEHYDRVARAENEATHSPVPREWGLAHLPADSALGREYLAVMMWCLRFAEESRRLMAEAVQATLDRRFPGAKPRPAIEIHHNYVALEEHFGESVWVHRKGAVRAAGAVIVPGSMGTASYIGEGLGNPQSFESCSHGAGRAMGRKQAKRSLSRDYVMAQLAERGVHLETSSKGDVAEEAPEAYKDIEDVMEYQRDLVRSTVRLRPMGVVKG
jgi:tRNA-splicing ligase RtcB